MVWSFLWRWVLASAVLVPLCLFGMGFAFGFVTADPAPISPMTNTLTAGAALVAAAVWAGKNARRRR